MKIYQPKDYKGNKLVSEELLASKNYATKGEVELKADQAYVDGELIKKADAAALEAHTSNDGIHVTLELKEKIDGQYSREETDALIASKAEQSEVDELTTKVNEKVNQTDFDELSDKVDSAVEDITSLQEETAKLPDITREIDSLKESKADQTALDQTKQDLLTEIENRTESMFHYKGSVDTRVELEEKQTDAQKGDVWNVEETDANYVWTGTDWDKLNERHDGLTNKKDFDNHVANTDIHVQPGEKEKWDDKYTKEETKAELDKKANVQTVESLQSTIQTLTERTETLESTSGSTTEKLETLLPKDDFDTYKTEAEGKFATKDEVSDVNDELDTLQSTVDGIQEQVTDLESSKAEATDLTKLTERVTKHEKDALKADSTFTFIPLVSTDCEEAESVECTGFTLANHLLTPGTISTLTLPGATDANACCNLFVSSDGITWVKLASSSTVEDGIWTFDITILPADLHLRCIFSTTEISTVDDGDTQPVTVNVKKSKSEDTDKISTYAHDGEFTPGIVCVTITFQQETSESVKEHITDGSKHLTENEKRNVQTLFSGYNGYSTLGDIEKKLNSAATNANLEELSRKVDQKAEQSALTELTGKVNKKAEQSALDTLKTEVAGKASSSDLAQVQADLADKASNSELKKVQDDLATKATTTALDSAKEELERQLGNKAETSVVELLQTKVSKLESVTIEQQIPEHETSQNAASAKAVADYVKSTKDELTTEIDSKADGAEFKTVSDQVTENTGSIQSLQEVIGTLAGGSDVTALQQRVDQLEQTKASAEDLTKAQATLQGSIDTNKKSIDAINEQIETMSDSIGGQLDTLSQQVEANTTALEGKVEDSVYQAKVTELEEKIDGKVSSEELTAKLVDKADKTYVDTQLEGKASATELVQVKEDLAKKASEESVTTLSSRVDDLESTDEDFETRITALESKKDPTVDQTYKPQSQNAQSGIAVAEGIKQATEGLTTQTALTEGLAGKANTETVTQLEAKVTTIETNLGDHTKNDTIHVKPEDKTKWNAKVDQDALTALETKLTASIDSKVGSVFHWKGTVDTIENLKAKEDPQIGDVWNVTGDGGANYVYSGEIENGNNGWDKLSEDLSGYAKSAQLTEHIADTEKHPSTDKQAAWDKKADQSDIDTAIEGAKAEIDTKLQDKADKTWVTELTSGLPTDSKVQELSDQLKNKVDKTEYEKDKATFATKTELESKVDTDSLTEQLGSYALQSALSTHEQNTELHVTKVKQDEWDKKVGTNDLSLALEGQMSTITSLLGQKANQSDLTDHTEDETIHLAEGDKEKWDAKLDASAFETEKQALEAKIAGKADSGAYDEEIESLTQQIGSKAEAGELTKLSEKVDGLKIPEVDQEYNGISTNAQSGTAVFGALKALKETLDGDLTDKLSGYATTSALEAQSTTLNSAIEEAKTTASTALTTHINDEKKHPSKEKQEAWDAKVDETHLTEAIEDAININNIQVGLKLAEKVDYTKFNEHKTDETIHVTEEEKTKIDNAITGAEVDSKLTAYTKTSVLTTQLADKVSKSDLTAALATKVEQDALEEALASKADDSKLQAHIDETEIHVTTKDKTSWNAKVDPATLNSAVALAQSTLQSQINAKASTEDLETHTGNTELHVQDGEKAKWNGKADQTWVTRQIDNAKTDLTKKIDGKADSSAIEDLQEQLDGKAEGTTVTALSGSVTTLETEVANMKESIDALEAGTVQIDDTYSSTSGHAISGKGVADALKNYATTASVSTLTEQVDSFQTALDGKADDSDIEGLRTELAGKLDEESLTEKLADYAKTEQITELTQQLGEKASTTDLTNHTKNETIHFTKDEKAQLKAQVTAVETGLNSKANSSELEGLQDQITQRLTIEDAALTYAKKEVTDKLTTDLAEKASQTEVTALTKLVEEKVDKAGLDSAIETALEGYVTSAELTAGLEPKADKKDLESLKTTVEGKIGQTELTTALEDYVTSTSLDEKLETKAEASTVEDLQQLLADKVDNATLTQKLGDYVKSTELTTKLNDKVDKTQLSNYVTQTEFGELEETVTNNTQAIETFQASLDDKVDDAKLTQQLQAYVLQTTFTNHTTNQDESVQHVTQAEKTGWNEKVDQELLDKAVSTGDDAVKEELRKEIKKVQDSIPTVDQEYNEQTFGQSANAQSGKSVQEALTKLQAKLLEDLTGGEISLEGYATTQDLEEQKSTLETSIRKAQSAADAAQETATQASTAAATAQSTADTAKSNLDNHIKDSEKHITTAERQQWTAKVDSAGLTEAIGNAKTEITQAYKDEIKQAVGSVFKWKGTVDNLTDLDDKKETAQVGDVWNVKKDGANYVWSGAEGEDGTGGWDKLSENLEGFATTEKLTEHTGDSKLHFTGSEKNEWNTQIQANKTGLASVTSQVLSHNESIENLQLKDQQIEATLKEKANSSDLEKYALDTDLTDLSEQVSAKATSAELTAHTGNNNIHFTNKTEKDNWKSDIDSTKSGLNALQGTVTTHTGDDTLHFEPEEKETWETDISGAKTDITQLKSKIDTTNTELLGLKGTVEGEQKKLKEHIADVTVAHFDTTEKAEMKASIQSLETQMANKVEQSAIDSAVAGLATEASVTAVSDSLQDLIDGIDHEWQSPESAESEGLQTGVAVAGAVSEHENKADIHVNKVFKDSLATKEYVDGKTAGLATSGNIESLSNDVKQAQTDLTTHTQNTNIHFESEEEKTEWSGKLTSHDTSISTLSTELQDTKGKYETLDVTVKEIQSNLDDKADVTALAKKADTTVTDGLQTKLTELEKKIPQVEETYTADTFDESTKVPTGKVVSEAITDSLSSYATTESVSSDISSAAEVAKTEVKDELQASIDEKASDTDFQAHKKDTNAHFTGTEKADLTKKVDKAVGDLDTVTKQVVEYGNTIETLQTKDGTLEASITSNTGEITSLKGKVDSNTGEITTLKSQVSTLQGQVVTVDEEWTPETSPKSVNAQSGVAVAGAIAEHKQEAGLHVTSELQTKWNKNSEDITALQTEVGKRALASDLANYTTTTKFTVLETTVKGHTTKLGALETTVASKIGDEELQTALEDYTTTADLTEKLDGKVDDSELEQLKDTLTQYETAEHATATYATKTTVSELDAEVKLKATQAEVDAIQEQLNTYATTESVTQQLGNYTDTKTLTGLLEKKADKTQITTLEGKLANKVDSSTLTTTLEDYVTDTELSEALSGKVDTSALTSYATTASVTALEKKVEGNTTNITDITSKLDDKVDSSELETLLDPFALKTALTAHENDKVAHVTKDERTKWDGKVDEEHLNSVVTTAVGAAKNELNQEITRVEDSIPEVDQEWTPETSEESVNAQSGVSVKGALDALHKTIQGEISTVSGQLGDYATIQQLEAQKTTLDTSIKKAQDTADAAKTAAQAAQTAAEDAQSTADSANAAADAAQETASGAQEAAATAQDTADAANTAASKAQTTAESASTAASKAQTDATKANTDLTSHKNNSTIHVTSTQTSKWDAKIDQAGLTSAIETATSTITSAYQTAINEAVGTVFKWKGTTESLETLKAIKEPTVGDVYNVTGEGGANYVWSGPENEDDGTGGWDKLSENLDGLASTAELNNHKNDSKAHFTNSEKSTWQSDISKAKTDIGTAQSDISSLQGSVGTLESEVEGLTSDLEGVTSQVLSHSSSIELLQQADEDFETKLSKKVDSTTLTTELAKKANTSDLTKYALQTTVTALNGQVSSLSTTVTELSDTVDGKADTSALDNYAKKATVDTLQTTVTSHATKIRELQTKLNDKVDNSAVEGLLEPYTLTTTFEGHTGDTEAHLTTEDRERWDTLVDEELLTSTVTAAVGAAKDELSGKITTVEGKIPKVDNKWTTGTSNKSTNPQSGVAVQGALDALHTTVTAEINAVDSKLSSYATTAQLTAHTGSADVHFTNIEKKDWKAQIDKVSTLETDLATATSQITHNSGEIEKLQTADTGFTASIGSIEVRLGDAEDSVEALQGQVAELLAKPDAIVDTVFGPTSDNAQSGRAINTELTSKYATKTEVNAKASQTDMAKAQADILKKLDTATFESTIKTYATAASVTEINEALEGKATTQQVSELELQVQENDTAITSLSETIETDYLTKEEAESTYLKITTAASTYLTIEDAASTYVTDAEFTALETTVNNKLDISTFNTTIKGYVPQATYDELAEQVTTLQATVQSLQERLTTLEGSAVTSTMVKHLAVYVNPDEAPPLESRDADTLYLVGSGSK